MYQAQVHDYDIKRCGYKLATDCDPLNRNVTQAVISLKEKIAI